MCSGSLNNQDIEKNLIKPGAMQSFASVILMQTFSLSLYFNCQFQIQKKKDYFELSNTYLQLNVETVSTFNEAFFLFFFVRHLKFYSVRSHCIHTSS